MMNTEVISSPASLEPDRVRRHTSAETLRRIDLQIEASIRHYATQPEWAISRRIDELEREWSVERWLEMNASTLAFAGTVLGLTRARRWFILPLMVTGFLFQHAVQGWCPPLPLLRRMRVRTRSEIERERFALKTLRGDFDDVNAGTPSQRVGQVDQVIGAVGA